MSFRGRTKTRFEIPDPFECQDPEINVNYFFLIHSGYFCMSTQFLVVKFSKLLPDQSLCHQLINYFTKTGNSSEYCQSALSKLNLDLRSAYISHTGYALHFLCWVHHKLFSGHTGLSLRQKPVELEFALCICWPFLRCTLINSEQ